MRTGTRGQGEEHERALVARVASGDRAAFEELYHAFARRLGGYLFKLLREQHLVEEALDDVLWVVWQKAGTFDPTARVSTWLFGIAHRKALKMMEQRRRHLRAVHPTDEAGELPRPDRPATPEESALRRDSLRQLARGIESLPAEQRAVVELTFFEGYSYAEVSQVMGCPVNTVKTRMFHARRQLRQALGRSERSTGALDAGT
ncbi:MAG: sigma-70 family RNA polymerase sigma factor [Myxococcota bacterium]|nr:sigma-70 family RNA polymerase sigma factor [Myxococcota bacterium]